MQPQKLQYCHSFHRVFKKNAVHYFYLHIRKKKKLYIMHFLHIFEQVRGADSRRKETHSLFNKDLPHAKNCQDSCHLCEQL